MIYQALLVFLTILNMKSTLIEAYDMAWFLRATKWTIEMLNLDSIWRNYEFLKKNTKNIY
jgi:hypothetical protein